MLEYIKSIVSRVLLYTGPQEYLNPKHEGVYAAPQPPHVGYDTSGIPTNLIPLMYTEYLVVKQKKEWLESNFIILEYVQFIFKF